MDLEEKLAILTDAAKYDVSCASSGSSRQGMKGGIGNTAPGGICHSWTADGRCVSLLKLLYTNNVCCYDCAYCVNRRSNDVPRASFSPDELARLTIDFYRRNMIEGLFLSSAVALSPDRTMERLIRVAEILRHRERFYGYIHMKVIPGTSAALVQRLGYLVDRVSVNAEFATDRELALLAPEKTRRGIEGNMLSIRDRKLELLPSLYRGAAPPAFVPAGQSTQMIVGAAEGNDRDILARAQSLYRQMGMKRVYYSAFVPVNLPAQEATQARTPLLREHRVYQADWLMRFYGFEAGEILGDHPFLDLAVDPKIAWAVKNFHLFPLDVNSASKEMLLRVPGLGPRSVERILAARRLCRLSYEALGKTGAVMRRARYFVSAQGHRPYPTMDDPGLVYRALAGQDKDASQQLSFLEAV